MLERRDNLFEDQIKWHKYRIAREEAQMVYKGMLIKMAALRHMCSFIKNKEILVFIMENFKILKERKVRHMINVAYAVKFKVRYDLYYCRRFNCTASHLLPIEVRLQKYLQWHMKYYGGIKYV